MRRLAVTIAVLALALPAAAEAAFPGANGRIAFPYVQLRQPPPPPPPQDPFERPGDASPVVVVSRFDTVLPGGASRETLYTFPAESPGYEQEQLTSEPAWSPDGGSVAFEQARRLAIIRADGTGLRLLPRLTDRDGSPSWSPNGRRLAFVGVRPCPTFCNWLFTVRSDGTDLDRVKAQRAMWPAWSVTGRIAFVNDDDDLRPRWPPDGLHTVRPDGKRRRHLFHRYWGEGAEPDWSPDGRRIAFAARQHIFTIGANGRGLRRLTDLGSPGNSAPAWSPDGRHIAFVGPGGIYVMRSDGREPRQIVAARQGETEWEVLGPPSWQPR